MTNTLNATSNRWVLNLVDSEAEIAKRSRFYDLPSADDRALKHLEELTYWARRSNVLRTQLGLPADHDRLLDNARKMAIKLEESLWKKRHNVK